MPTARGWMVYSRITASSRHFQKGIATPGLIDGKAPLQTLPIFIPGLGIKFQRDIERDFLGMQIQIPCFFVK